LTAHEPSSLPSPLNHASIDELYRNTPELPSRPGSRPSPEAKSPCESEGPHDSEWPPTFDGGKAPGPASPIRSETPDEYVVANAPPSPLESVDPDESIDGDIKFSGTVQLSEDWLEQTTKTLSKITGKIQKHDTWEKLDAEGWPAGLDEVIVPDLRRAIEDENIQDVTATPEDADNQTYHMQFLCQRWGRIYPIEMVRQSAIRKAESHLAGCMGDKYQEIVLRCLRSDFGLSGAAPESEWLREFNWRVVRSIEQCCV
jgi:hypothetical protein